MGWQETSLLELVLDGYENIRHLRIWESTLSFESSRSSCPISSLLCDQGSSHREGQLIDSANRSNIEYTTAVTCHIQPASQDEDVQDRWILSRVMLLSSSRKRTECNAVPGPLESKLR